MDTAVPSEGRPCSDNEPCGPGTFCDPATQRCVSGAATDTGIKDTSGDLKTDISIHDGPVKPDISVNDGPVKPDLPAPDMMRPDVSKPDAPIPDAQVPDQMLPDTLGPDIQPPHTITCLAAFGCAFYCGKSMACKNTCRSRTTGINRSLYDKLQSCVNTHCASCTSLDMLGCYSCLDISCPQESSDCDTGFGSFPNNCAEGLYCLAGCAPGSCTQACSSNMSSNGLSQLQALLSACPSTRSSCGTSSFMLGCMLVDYDSSCPSQTKSCMQGYP